METNRSALLCPLALCCMLAATVAAGQSDFRLEPWKDVAPGDKEYAQLHLDTTGSLVGRMPNYIYNGRCGTCPAGERGAGITFNLGGNAAPDQVLKTALKERLARLKPQASAFQALCSAASDTLFSLAHFDKWTGDGWDGNSGGAWPAELKDVLSHDGGALYKYELEFWPGTSLPGAAPLVNPQRAPIIRGRSLSLTFTTLNTGTGPLRFRLKRTDVHSDLLVAWLDRMKKRHMEDVAELREEAKGLSNEMDRIARLWSEDIDPVGCASVAADARAVLARVRHWSVRSAKATSLWKLSWAWYTGDVSAVDPFKRRDLPAHRDTTGYEAAKLKREVLLGLLQGGRANCSLSEANAMLDEWATVSGRIESDESYLNELKAARRAREHPAVLSPEVALPAHMVYVSDKSDANFMVHLDAKRKFARMNAAERNTYYTYEKPHILGHHFRGDSASLSLATTLTAETPTTALSRDLTGPLALIGQLPALAVAPYSSLFTRIVQRASFTKVKDGGGNKLLADKIAEDRLICRNVLDSLQAELEVERSKAQDYHRELDAVLSVMTEVERPTEGTELIYTHEVRPTTPFEGNNKVDYSVQQTTGTGEAAKVATLATGSFKLYKPQRVQVFGGLAYTMREVSRTSISASGGSADVTRADERFRFMAGLKWHAFKKGGTDLSDNRLVGTWRRLAIVGAVGIPKPLDDLYLGLSYDIVPGFNLALMNHWYRNETAAFQNGVITETRSYYPLAFTPAVALTFDSSLFTSAINLLSK